MHDLIANLGTATAWVMSVTVICAAAVAIAWISRR